MKVIEAGKKMQVKGYMAILCCSQIWIKAISFI